MTLQAGETLGFIASMLPRWQKGREKTLRALASPTSALHAGDLLDAPNTCSGMTSIPRRQPMPVWQKQL